MQLWLQEFSFSHSYKLQNIQVYYFKKIKIKANTLSFLRHSHPVGKFSSEPLLKTSSDIKLSCHGIFVEIGATEMHIAPQSQKT